MKACMQSKELHARTDDERSRLQVEDKDLWCRGVVCSCYQNIKEPLLFYRDPLQFKISTYI